MQNVSFELQRTVSHPHAVQINDNAKMSSKFPMCVHILLLF